MYMKQVDSRVKILNLLEKGDLGVTEISKKLRLSTQIIHRHINDLLADRFILKKGSAPHTIYCLNPGYKFTRVVDDFSFAQKQLLPEFKKKYKNLKIKFSQDKLDLDFMLKSSAVYSSNIEGVSLDLNSFMNVGKLSRGAQKEAREIEDLVSAYDFAESNKLNESNFLKSHKLSSQHLLSKSKQGKYRSEAVGVFGQEGLVYSGPEYFLVTNEMTKLFEVVESLLNKDLTETETVFWAAWLHLEIALVHPFLDGNGRTARLLEKWFLAEKIGEQTWLLQTEKFYFENRQQYYKSLRKSSNYWEAKFTDFVDYLNMLFGFLTK